MVMQAFRGLGLGGIAPSSPVQATQAPFRSNYGVTQGDAAFDTVAEIAALVDGQVAAGEFLKIWQLTVPAQQKHRWGFGNPALQRNQGFMWAVFGLDAGTGFQEGVIRLVIANARETRKFIVAELPSESLHTVTNTSLATATPTDIDAKIPLPEKIDFPLVREDSLQIIEHQTTIVTTTVDSVGFEIPVSIYQ